MRGLEALLRIAAAAEDRARGALSAAVRGRDATRAEAAALADRASAARAAVRERERGARAAALEHRRWASALADRASRCRDRARAA